MLFRYMKQDLKIMRISFFVIASSIAITNLLFSDWIVKESAEIYEKQKYNLSGKNDKSSYCIIDSLYLYLQNTDLREYSTIIQHNIFSFQQRFLCPLPKKEITGRSSYEEQLPIQHIPKRKLTAYQFSHSACEYYVFALRRIII